MFSTFPEPEDQARVEELLAEFGLDKTAKVGTLSGVSAAARHSS